MILAFDLGGTLIKYGVIEPPMTFLMKSDMETNAHEGGHAIINRMIDMAKTLQKQYPITGIAISSAGVIEPVKGIVLTATDAIPDFIGLPIKALFEEQTQCFTTVENDVNCVALAEASLSTHPVDDFVALTIGTGIGGGIVYQGKIIHGHAYSAGEWGKMYINGRPYEKLASMSALLEHAKSSGLQVVNGAEVFKLYDRGDLVAHSVVQRFYHYLSLGVANIIFTLNPKVVMIGGGISNRKDRFIEEFTQVLRLHLPPYYCEHVEIRLPEFLNDSGMLGACVHHLQQQSH